VTLLDDSVNSESKIDTGFVDKGNAFLVGARDVDTKLLFRVGSGAWIFAPIETNYAHGAGGGER
jgi:hypothetical protein